MTPDQYESLAALMADESARTREEFSAVRQDIEKLATLVATEAVEVRARFTKLEGRLGGVEGRLEGVEGRLTRVEVTGEQTRHQVQVVAEVVTHLDRKLETLRQEMHEGFRDVHDEMRAGFATHDRRLRALEG